MVTLALATRSRASADTGDFQALQNVEQRLVQKLTRLEAIRSSAEKIRKHAEAIEKQVATGEKKLGKIIADATLERQPPRFERPPWEVIRRVRLGEGDG